MNDDTTSFVIDEQKINEQIYSCLNVNSPKSFFLFAGAGSGKTRSLVKVLERFKEERISELRNSGKKIAVITYTNAACDEIKRRLDFDTSFHISTVHSFAWEVIKTYTHDIKAWLVQSLENNIRELKELQSTTMKPRNQNPQVSRATNRTENRTLTASSKHQKVHIQSQWGQRRSRLSKSHRGNQSLCSFHNGISNYSKHFGRQISHSSD